MLTKNHLKIHTSKPAKRSGVRKKRVYFCIESSIPNHTFINYNSLVNDRIKGEILELCYGDLTRKLHQLRAELMQRERYPDQFAGQVQLINEILGKTQ